MKILDRPVRRQTRSVVDCNRPATITLHEGDVIGFRLYGERREYRLSVKAAYFAAKRTEQRHGQRLG